MSTLINLNDARKKLNELEGSAEYNKGVTDAFNALFDLPIIEAEPIKHGRWIWNKRLGEWYCSNCDRIMNPYTVEKSEGLYEMAQPFYCGWCGARMDESEAEE